MTRRGTWVKSAKGPLAWGKPVCYRGRRLRAGLAPMAEVSARGRGGTGRHAGFRFLWALPVGVQLPPPAPRAPAAADSRAVQSIRAHPYRARPQLRARTDRHGSDRDPQPGPEARTQGDRAGGRARAASSGAAQGPVAARADSRLPARQGAGASSAPRLRQVGDGRSGPAAARRHQQEGAGRRLAEARVPARHGPARGHGRGREHHAGQGRPCLYAEVRDRAADRAQGRFRA
jgi:hypothetical protein